MMELNAKTQEALAYIRANCALEPVAGIILGTGLGSLADAIRPVARFSYEELPYFPKATVETHAGELILGDLAGKPVAAFSGRFHVYEGYSMQQISFPVRVAKALGANTLVLSNAAGGLNPQFSAGDIMLITDHINFMGNNPLIGPNDESLGPRFPDMSEPYTKSLIELAERVALAKSIKVQRGVYLACPGPSLETRAEYRFMRMLGADAVGMSTVPEVIVAVHAGLKVLAFSAITDECLPDALEPANVDRILKTAAEIEPRITEIVADCMKQIPV